MVTLPLAIAMPLCQVSQAKYLGCSFGLSFGPTSAKCTQVGHVFANWGPKQPTLVGTREFIATVGQHWPNNYQTSGVRLAGDGPNFLAMLGAMGGFPRGRFFSWDPATQILTCQSFSPTRCNRQVKADLLNSAEMG